MTPTILASGRPLPHEFDDARGRLQHLRDARSFGFFTGRFIKGQFARLSHALLYRRYQLALHGTARAALLWAAERINALVQPKIRLT